MSVSTHWQFTVRGESPLCGTGFMRGSQLISRMKSAEETGSRIHFPSSGRRPKILTPDTGNVYKNVLGNKICVHLTVTIFLSYMLDAHLFHFRVINMFPSDRFWNMRFTFTFHFCLNMQLVVVFLHALSLLLYICFTCFYLADYYYLNQ